MYLGSIGRSRRFLGCVLAATSFGVVPHAVSAAGPDVSGLLAQAGAALGRKATLSPAQRKVDSELRAHAGPEAAPRGQITRSSAHLPHTPWRKEDRLRVIIKVTGKPSDHAGALAAAGLDIEILNDGFGLVQGWVAGDAVLGLAGLETVRSISPAWPGEPRAGNVTSEGDGATRADLVRQLGYEGTGVVVGVISDGIDSLAARQASADLPAVTVPSDPRCHTDSGDEGTAMLEIVHDLAPGATLLFASGVASAPTMIDAIECLTAAGADVIVDDLGFAQEPYFEDGAIAQAAAASVAAGVSYHSAAGNDQARYYVAPYLDLGDGFHDFGSGDRTNTVSLGPGGLLRCRLQWNDPFGASGNDYDLWIVDALGTRLAAGENVQDGDDDPLETVAFFNAGPSPRTLGLAILRFAGDGRRLKLLCDQGGPDLEYGTPDTGIYGHPAVSEVIAVGAIDAFDPGLDDVESFSSRGPALVFFPAPVARPKPDLAAFDGVTTTAPGFAPFFGTSAAAPHSAAVAALLLSKNSTLSPADVQRVLTSTAIDIEAVGFDHAAGAGRIDALAAINAVSATTTSTTTLPTTTVPVSTTLPTTTTVPTSTTLPVPTTSTTLPACDPDDCDGSPCTVGDTCLAGMCRPGATLTMGQLRGSVLDDTGEAAAVCAGDRPRSVRKVVQRLTQVARLLRQAGNAANEQKRREKRARAERAARHASQRLGKERGRLSPACAAILDTAIGAIGAGLACPS